MTGPAAGTHGLPPFLEGLIDYAGMFPPANLPLAGALENFLEYTAGPDAWMLAGFILPAADATAAAELLAGRTLARPPQINLLGKGGADWTAFFAGLTAELERVEHLRTRLGDGVRVEVFETPVPAAELDFQIRADALVDRAADLLNGAGLLPYFEVPAGPHWHERVERLLHAIARRSGGSGARFKIRTGGLDAAAFPSVAALARTIAAAHQHGAAFKCTAGLHHPIRGYRTEVGTEMHGFVNVFAAAVLTHARGLAPQQIEAILAEQDADAFRFSGAGLAWKDIAADAAEIRTARQQFAAAFGSCSFDEPREDLQALGWR